MSNQSLDSIQIVYLIYEFLKYKLGFFNDVWIDCKCHSYLVAVRYDREAYTNIANGGIEENNVFDILVA